MKQDGNGQHCAGDPMVSDPVKLKANLRQERGKQQREHRSRHDPVKHPCRQRMPRDAFGQARRQLRGNASRELFTLREIPQIDGVNDEESQPRDGRDPDQKPRNVNGHMLPPWTRSPLNYATIGAHFASSTPPMARFTRFRISGILYALNCKGTAPCTASFPAIVPVSALGGLPRTASSTALSRRGRAAAPLTAMRMRSIRPFET